MRGKKARWGWWLAAGLLLGGCGGGARGGDYGQSADDAYAAGQRLEAGGDLEGASAAYREALAQNPRLFVARLALAWTLRRRGLAAEALGEAQEASELDGRSVGAKVLVAELSVELGEHQRGLEAAEAALALEPRSAEAQAARGRALWGLGRTREALEVYEAGLKVYPRDAALQRLAAEALLGLGLESLALPRLEALAREMPEDVEVLLTLGRAYLELELYERALEPLRAVTARAEGNAQGHLWLGRAYLARGQDPLAVIELQKAAALDPSLADALVALGEAEFRRGYPDRALSYVAQAMEKDPAQVSAYLLKAQVLERQQDDAGVEATLREALAQNPQGWRAALALARHLQELGRKDEARAALAPFAGRAESPAAVSLLAAELEEGAAALPHLVRALSRRDDPKLLRRVVALEAAHPGQSAPEERLARALLLQERTGGRDPEVIGWLARAHAAAGDKERALGLLDAAQERFGEDPRLETARQAIGGQRP
jgi:tetratricopeptide (TPR) repeat protein